MTTSERLATAYEEAVRALATRAAKAGVADAEGFAREFIAALHGQGWRAYAPVTVLPVTPVRPSPPTEEFVRARRQLGRQRPPTEGDMQ